MPVWRNKTREDKLNNGTVDEQAEAAKQPPVLLCVEKQRNGDFEGKLTVDFNPSTYQYRTLKESFHGRNYLQT